MIRNINTLLLRRMLVLWAIASLLAGGAALYVELEKVDDQVVALATRGAAEIEQQVIEMIPAMDRGAISALDELAQRLIKSDFVIVELYDTHQKHLAAAVRHDSDAVDRALKNRHHKFPLDGVTHYEKFYIDDQLYIQVLVPLFSRDGERHPHGYFEGVYRVDDQTLEGVESHIITTLVLVLTLILATFVMLYPLILHLNRELFRFSSDLFRANIELLEVMGSAIAKRDSTTDSHNYRVTLYAARLGEALRLDDVQMSHLIAGAFLHDVGKIGIEDSILCKPARLSEGEFARMKEHVLIGIDIIAKANWLHGARQVIEYHHERFDGSGYMKGLKGEEIPVAARIFAIADVFDALTSERPYKEALPLETAMEMMERERGSHFDPRMLDLFISMAPGLHKNIGSASYQALTRMLSQVVRRHFFNARMQGMK